MKNLKKLFLIVKAPAFVLLLSWILSIYNDFSWNGIIFFVIATLILQILLCIANYKKLDEPNYWFILAGTLYALIETNMWGDYEYIFSFFATIIFAFTTFFISFPSILKWLKRKH
jgi:hypothetical protein